MRWMMLVGAVANGLGAATLVSAEATATTRPASAPAGQGPATAKAGRPWLGMSISAVDDPAVQEIVETFGYTEETGVFVQGVVPGSPAAGKLKAGDILVKANGEEITEIGVLMDHLAAAGVGGELTFEVFREQKMKTVTMTVGAAPQRQAVTTTRSK